MGSHIVLWLESADMAATMKAFQHVEALFGTVEQALSRFRSDSELSRFNARQGEWVPVSELLWEQVLLSVQMAAATNGRFDPTLLTALENAGYVHSFEPRAGNAWSSLFPESAPALGQWQTVEFDETRRALRVPPGVQIDLGGITKGDTAQKGIALMQAIGPCLVDAGGDLVAGAAPDGYLGWPVAISSPWTDSATEPPDLAALWLADGAMATSGVDYRTWHQNETRMHHIIDPLTGSSANTDGLTVTVMAPDAATADAWATATLVGGSALGMHALLEQDLAGMMITQDGRILVTPQMDQLLQGQPDMVTA